MKISSGKIRDFLASERPKQDFVLFYGPDQGLVHERGKSLTKKFFNSPINQTSITEFTAAELKENPETLSIASHSFSLLSKNQVIYIQEGEDFISSVIKKTIESDIKSWPIIVEAGELSVRSSLRKLFENNKKCAAIACYPDEGKNLDQTLRQILNDYNIKATDEALLYLNYFLTGDRMIVRREIEKIALFAGYNSDKNTEITAEDVQCCIANSSKTSLDELIFTVCSGSQKKLEDLLPKFFEEGINSITIIRALQRHFQRLQLIKGLLEKGNSYETAIQFLKPPIFFKWKIHFQNQAKAWSILKINFALSVLSDYELLCKQTGIPSVVLCKQLLMRIAQGAKNF